MGLVLLSGSVFSQKLSFTASGGYGFAVFQESIGENRPSASGKSELEYVKASFGRGAKIFIGAEYASLKHLHLGLSVGYHYCIPSYSASQDVSKYSHYSGHYYNTFTKSKTTWDKISQWQVVPSFKLLIGKEARYYLKCGVVLGLGGRMRETFSGSRVSAFNSNNYTPAGTVDSVLQTTYYTKGYSLGVMGWLGSEKKLKGNLHVFAEAALVYMYWLNGHRKITEWSNGVTSTSQSNKPFEEELPYSSINIMVGARWFFGKKITAASASGS